jgi:uncharacterized OsmC-like protein
MEAVSRWIEGVKSVVDNGRNHSVVIDMISEPEGRNMGPTALELTVMGLAGCVSTSFAYIARKARLGFEELKVVVDAKKGEKTIETAEVKVYVKAEDKEKAVRIFEKSVSSCPVGILFEKAGVKLDKELVFL